jgi:iron complex outermembrane receptor protein
MKTSLKFLLSGASVGLMALATQAAYAQTAGAPSAPPAPAPPSAGDQGAIVVTARRTAENVQHVPISITVFSQQQLTDAGVHNAQDLSKVTPGLSMQSTGSSRVDSTFSIRGQGATFGTASGVITYFADVPDFVAGSDITPSPAAIYDLSDIQVLKGPQGTLFGKNTTGGAILFVPHPATDQFGGYIDARLGNYNRHDGEFAINIPIVGDKIDLRVAGQSLNRDGFTTYKLDGSKLDNENRQSFRVTLTFRPNEHFENTTIYQDSMVHENGSGAILQKAIDTGACYLFQCGNDSVYGAMAADVAEQQRLGIRTALGNDPDHFILQDSNGVINTSTLEVNDHLTLKNIASMRWYRAGQSWDFDATNETVQHVLNQPSAIRTYGTEEFQAQVKAGPLSGVAGFFWSENRTPWSQAYATQTLNAQVFTSPPGCPTLPIPGTCYNGIAGDGAGGINFGSTFDQSNATTTGYYSQVNWKPTDQLTLTGGVRYTQDYTQDASETELTNMTPGFCFNCYAEAITPPPFFPELVNSHGDLVVAPYTNSSAHFHALTWNFAVNYVVNPDLDVYATARSGYKVGGINATTFIPQDKLFQPETDIDYEVGIKGQHDFGGFRTRFAIDGFYDDYTNIQRFENLEPQDGIPQTATKNAAAGYIDGFDLDLTLIPNDIFQIEFAYTYLNAKYTKWNGGVGIGDLTNQKFPNTPTDELTVTPRVTFPIPHDVGNLTLQATIYYQSAWATDPFNVPISTANANAAIVNLDAEGANLPQAYTKVDLRLDWRHVYGSQVSLAAYVLNVTNAVYIVGTTDYLNSSVGTLAALYSEPRFYGAEIRFDF